ncbi:FecR family protein [Sphingobium nicotianae]|nr:FecR domain-containing protein [Sphingobium nicotianae]
MRIDEAVLDEDEQTAFDMWLEGDLRRVGAFARAQAVLVHAKRAKALGSDFEPTAFTPDPADPASITDGQPAPRRLTRRKLLIGASAIAATGVFAMVLPLKRASAKIYETSRGETRLVPLEDGSTVTLNTDSSIAVTIDGEHRTVALTRGEALFKVATAEHAPLIVEAGDTALRAQNATFTVCRLDDELLKVRVCEGSVEVRRDTSEPRLLRANMQATLPANGAFIARNIAPETLRRELSWQEGMLSFEDTPLRQAADEFARYSDRRIGIGDPTVGAETVTGLYAANNPEGFARAVALSLNLHVQSSAGGIILSR